MLDYIKDCVSQKKNIIKLKRQAIWWEKIFSRYVNNKNLHSKNISSIYKSTTKRKHPTPLKALKKKTGIVSEHRNIFSKSLVVMHTDQIHSETACDSYYNGKH